MFALHFVDCVNKFVYLLLQHRFEPLFADWDFFKLSIAHNNGVKILCRYLRAKFFPTLGSEILRSSNENFGTGI